MAAKRWKIAGLVFLVLTLTAIVWISFGAINWQSRVTFDGLLTLIGGIAAFLAVMIQVEEQRSARASRNRRAERAP